MKISWRREWWPTPVLLPGRSHGWRSLVGLQPMGLQKVRHDWVTCHHLSNGNELSCHEKILEELKYILLSERSWSENATPYPIPTIEHSGKHRNRVTTLWPPDVKNQLIWKDPDAGIDWGHEEKRATKDEMIGGHHGLNRHELQQTPGDGKGHGSLVCCSPRGHKESHTTWWLNNNNGDVKKISGWPTSEGGMNQGHMAFKGSENTLYDTLIADTYHYLTSQAH